MLNAPYLTVPARLNVMGKRPRGTCPVCDRYIAIKKDGTLLPHGHPSTIFCAGAGQQPRVVDQADLDVEQEHLAVNLPIESFPFTVEYFTADGTVVYSTVVEAPGVLHVPPLAKTYGPVNARVQYPQRGSVPRGSDRLDGTTDAGHDGVHGDT